MGDIKDPDPVMRFDLLDALFTNLNTVGSFHPGIVHDDSERSDSSNTTGTDSEPDLHPNHKSIMDQNQVPARADRFHIELTRFTMMSDITESIARYHRFRLSMIR